MNPNRCRCGKSVQMRVIRMRGTPRGTVHWLEHRDGTTPCGGEYKSIEIAPADSYDQRGYTLLLEKWNADNPKEN